MSTTILLGGCSSADVFHKTPYLPYEGHLPDYFTTHAKVYFARHITDTPLIYTGWADKYGPLTLKSSMPSKDELPHFDMRYQNRMQGLVRHDELIELPIGSMFAAKGYHALRRFYSGKADLQGDLIDVAAIPQDSDKDIYVLAIKGARFFEHPLNHFTIDLELALYVRPAGSESVHLVEHRVLKRTLPVSSWLSSTRKFLQRTGFLLDEALDEGLEQLIREVPDVLAIARSG